MRILAVEPEGPALQQLTRLLRQLCPGAVIDSYLEPAPAAAAAEQLTWSIAFIALSGEGGLDLGQTLRARQPGCNLIFLSHSPEYALAAMNLRASGYLLKPVTEAALAGELAALRYPLPPAEGPLLRISCFGNFEVFTPAGAPVKFSRAKSKELFAYLIYRRGSSCAIRELAAALFEDNAFSPQQMTYLQQIISSMVRTLKEYGAEATLEKSYNAIALRPELLSCDYYRFLNREPAALSAYAGEFMSQYSWAEFVVGYLDRMTTKTQTD